MRVGDRLIERQRPAVCRLGILVVALLLERVPQLYPDRGQTGRLLQRAAVVLCRNRPVAALNGAVARPDRRADTAAAADDQPDQAPGHAVFAGHDDRPEIPGDTLLLLPLALLLLDGLAQPGDLVAGGFKLAGA